MPLSSQAQTSTALQFDADILARRSQWREYAPDGDALLTERGSLYGISFGARWIQPDWAMGLRWHRLSGRRDYEGQTQQDGGAIHIDSTTDVREVAWTLSASHNLPHYFSLTGAIQPTRTLRSIRDVANEQGGIAVNGYPEYWRWTLASADLQWSKTMAAGRLSLNAGFGLTLRNSMDVTFPGSDASQLKPGRGHARRLGVTYDHPIGHVVGRPVLIRTGVQWQELRFGASQSVPQMRNGVFQQALLRQPATTLRDTTLRLMVEMPFETHVTGPTARTSPP